MISMVFFYNVRDEQSWQDVTMDSKWTKKQELVFLCICSNIFTMLDMAIPFFQTQLFTTFKLLSLRGAEMI